MAHPKIVFSIPAHEKPAVIADQIANLQRFAPGSQVVLHLSEGFYYFKKRFEVRSEAWMRRSTIPRFRAMPGVWVNDARMPTEWGNILHTHLSNFRYADANLDFDVFVLLSSSCLLVRSGVGEVIARHDYGVDLPVAPKDWEWRAKSEDDPIFQAIVRDSGAREVHGSQSEGTYYRRDLFRRMADVIERRWRFTPGHVRVHEEVYLPTVASTLGGINGFSPIILKEDPTKYPPLDRSLVDAIRSETLERVVKDPSRLLHRGTHFFGLRPVPRSLNDPLRTYVRSLAVETPPVF